MNVINVGVAPWSREEIVANINEFLCLYEKRPIKDNMGGMKSPHMFATWFITKKISPDLIVESGVWKGQSTWLFENACPDAKLVSIDIDLHKRQYISGKTKYFDEDFSTLDWSEVTDKSLVFFDDHSNAYDRIKQCKWFGFKHIIFEDNYPPSRGDYYSLKKAFAHAGFNIVNGNEFGIRLITWLRKIFVKLTLIPMSFMLIDKGVKPNSGDDTMLRKNLEIYYEFPPIFKTSKTRWGDCWIDNVYPTPKPLFEHLEDSNYKIFLDEADTYTWLSYVKLI